MKLSEIYKQSQLNQLTESNIDPATNFKLFQSRKDIISLFNKFKKIYKKYKQYEINSDTDQRAMMTKAFYPSHIRMQLVVNYEAGRSSTFLIAIRYGKLPSKMYSQIEAEVQKICKPYTEVIGYNRIYYVGEHGTNSTIGIVCTNAQFSNELANYLESNID